MPAKRSRLAAPDEQRENNFLPKMDNCVMIAMLPVDPVDGAGLRDDAMERGKLRSVPLNGLTAFARSIPAGRPGRETATAANFQRQSIRRYGRPAGPYTLALDSPTLGQGSDRRATGRMRVARKWRRKGLKRLSPRPEMASGRTGRSAGPRSGVSYPRWRSRMRVGWKCCCNSLKGLIPRPGM